jgi:CheY-like chemotaxis protein
MPNTGDHSYRVLVIEDNPADTLLIKEAFEDSGYVCELTITQGNMAEMLLSTEFDLVLLDCGMPLEKTQARVALVRTRAPYIPIVILSGYPDPIPAYKAGANAFIRKGFGIEELFGKIKGLLDFWSNIAELPSRRS